MVLHEDGNRLIYSVLLAEICDEPGSESSGALDPSEDLIAATARLLVPYCVLGLFDYHDQGY